MKVKCNNIERRFMMQKGSLHKHLENAINDLKKQLERVENRQFFLSERLLIDAIKNIDDLSVQLMKQAF